jgi:hypothetical protein
MRRCHGCVTSGAQNSHDKSDRVACQQSNASKHNPHVARDSGESHLIHPRCCKTRCIMQTRRLFANKIKQKYCEEKNYLIRNIDKPLFCEGDLCVVNHFGLLMTLPQASAAQPGPVRGRAGQGGEGGLLTCCCWRGSGSHDHDQEA